MRAKLLLKSRPLDTPATLQNETEAEEVLLPGQTLGTNCTKVSFAAMTRGPLLLFALVASVASAQRFPFPKPTSVLVAQAAAALEPASACTCDSCPGADGKTYTPSKVKR